LCLFYKNSGKEFCGDNIKMDLKEMGWESTDWMCLAEHADRWTDFVETAMNLGVP
jgi:hypothetical protein